MILCGRFRRVTPLRKQKEMYLGVEKATINLHPQLIMNNQKQGAINEQPLAACISG